MANYLNAETVTHIKQLRQAGNGIRAISRQLGISTNTVTRYISNNDGILCACGKPAGHRYWCLPRYKKSAARQAYHPNWTGGPKVRVPKGPRYKPYDNQYPFVSDGMGGHELLTFVNSKVPRELPPDMRADLCQNLIVGILSGDIDESLPNEDIKVYTRMAWQSNPSKYGDLSLDSKIFQGSDTTFLDMLADPATVDNY